MFIFRTLKLNGVAVTILLDSGAQANLISKQVVVSHSTITMARGQGLRMRFANNEEAKSVGEVVNATLIVQGMELKIPSLHVAPFTMEGADIILGTPFLQQCKHAELLAWHLIPNCRFHQESTGLVFTKAVSTQRRAQIFPLLTLSV